MRSTSTGSGTPTPRYQFFAQNLSPKKIQARLGHASITETMDTYGHLYPDDDTSVREVIESAFDDAMLTRQAASQRFTRQEAKS